jgi:hypothetical protein
MDDFVNQRNLSPLSSIDPDVKLVPRNNQANQEEAENLA